ncbi:MAG TPA: nuclear transport factor 2 family protein [Pyrinomonadaceae bacterium]|nr:nuclear transport factor 2 family protein [Pyrinomonadaceae bacterium]
MQFKTAEQSPAEIEVLGVIKDFNRAFKNNDPEKYFSYIDDQITVITPSNPYRVEGIKDDREEFEFGIRSGAARVNYFQEMQPKVQLYGEMAVVTYFSRGSYGPEGGAKTFYFKETDVLVKKEGTWKIVHIHVSASAKD